MKFSRWVGLRLGFSITFEPILIEFTAAELDAWKAGDRTGCSDAYCRKLPGSHGFGEYLVGRCWEGLGYRWIHHDYDVFGGNKPGKYPESEAILKRALGADRLSAVRQLYKTLYPLREDNHAPVEQPDLLIFEPDSSEIRFAECKRLDTDDSVNPRQILGLFLLGAVLGCPVDLFIVAEAGKGLSVEPVTFSYSAPELLI